MTRSRRALVLSVCLLAAGAFATPAQAAPARAAAGEGAAASAPTTSRFVPLAPARVLDTRDGTGTARGVVPPKGSVVLQVTGRDGVPASGVTAVVLNVTLTASTGSGFVQVYPTGRAAEGASSNLNVQGVGRTVPVLVVAPVGDGGRVTLYTHGGGHLLADLQGYFVTSGETAAGRYRPLTPARVLDTRTGEGVPSGAKGALVKGSALTLQLTGRGGVPSSGVSAVALNVTSTGSRSGGFVQVVPSAGGTAAGASSNLNHTAGQTVANLVVVPVGDSGAVDVYSSSGTHVLADVAGWFTDDTTAPSGTGLFVPVAPTRLVDTRSGSRPVDGARVAVAPLGQAGIPSSGVSSVVLNVTATLPAAGGFVQVLPEGQGTVGSSSNLNLERPGQTIANAALATLGDGGRVTLYTLHAAHLLADVAGWFTSGDAGSGPVPAELAGLRVAPRTADAYDPAAWPSLDADGDCQDTATEVLLARSVYDATLSDDGCAVTQGLWKDAWTGANLFAGDTAAVEPAVSFQNATVSGAAGWDAARRAAFANDLEHPEHLAVVAQDVVDARAGRAPEDWRPRLDSAVCGYARAWAGVKTRWDLSVTQAELDALRTMLASC